MEYQRVRDGSRQRGLLVAAGRRRMTWEQVQDTVDEVVGWRYPTPRLTARTGQVHRGWYSGRECHIRLLSPDGLYPLAVVLHELAHHVHWCRDERVRLVGTTAERRRWWHGPEFVRVLDELLEDWYR